VKLSEKQRLFTVALAKLLTYAGTKGYEFTLGDAYMKPGSNDGRSGKSCHRHRLAIDLNLFVNGEYIRDSWHKAWDDLHSYWEILGGSKAIENDKNHFSFEHQGYR